MTVLLLLLTLPFAHAESRTAKLYEIGKTSGEPLYVQKINIETTGTRRVQTSTIEDSAGKVQMTEKAVLVDGRVVSQNIDHLQINESYELEVRDKGAVFRTFKMVDGKRGEMTEEKVRKLPETFVTGPGTEPFLRKFSSVITDNKTLKTQFGVFEMGDFVGMKFKKTKLSEDGKTLSVEMSPSNVVINMFFDPIQLELDPESYQLRRYIGRTPLRKMVDGKSKPWDAEIIYSPAR